MFIKANLIIQVLLGSPLLVRPETTPASCSPGFALNGSCVECKQGYWNNGNASMGFEPCQKCPDNLTTESTGATDAENCSIILCGAGYFVSTPNRTCIKCPHGRYKNTTDRSESCILCPPDFTTEMTGATSLQDCILISDCPPGKYKTSPSQCSICPKGSYSSSPASETCQSCESPLTTNNSGSTSESDCNGLCYFNERKCSNGGSCEVDIASGKYHCKCRDLYSGTYCDDFSAFYAQLIGYLAGGMSAAIILVLLIAYYIKCYRPRQLRKRERKHRDYYSGLSAPHREPHEYVDFSLRRNTNLHSDYLNRNPSYTHYDAPENEEVYDTIYEELPPDPSRPNDEVKKQDHTTSPSSDVFIIYGHQQIRRDADIGTSHRQQIASSQTPILNDYIQVL
uniref:EGF-like domain-containing protein n=1 Tax=Biomphalaria glabrata TaxID=6526 RepID=A0A2C9KXV0_BIOGL